MSMVILSCQYERFTAVNLYYKFHNDTEHIIEIKNHRGSGQVDYYKINPNSYLFLEKSTNAPGAAKENQIMT